MFTEEQIAGAIERMRQKHHERRPSLISDIDSFCGPGCGELIVDEMIHETVAEFELALRVLSTGGDQSSASHPEE